MEREERKTVKETVKQTGEGKERDGGREGGERVDTARGRRGGSLNITRIQNFLLSGQSQNERKAATDFEF